jgi:hypothetical protein
MRIDSELPQHDTKLECIKLLEIILLHCRGTVTKHTSTRTTCIHASKFKLGLKVEEGCSCHLVAVSAPQFPQFSHYKINLITLLTYHVHASPISSLMKQSGQVARSDITDWAMCSCGRVEEEGRV